MKKKTVLITGASRGIGAAIARQFADNGYHIIINCINSKDKLLQLKKELENIYHITCFASVGDIGSEDYVNSLFSEIRTLYGSLDVLVNNAGISMTGLLTDMTLSQWNQIIQTNLTSVFLCSKAAAALMITQHSGCIVNISSVWGNVGASCEVAYSSSKGGVQAFTKALAKELAPSNIQVNAIACGAIDTDMNKHLSDSEINELVHEIPACRMGTPDEVANSVYSLANSPAYLTGQIIALDGAWI